MSTLDTIIIGLSFIWLILTLLCYMLIKKILVYTYKYYEYYQIRYYCNISLWNYTNLLFDIHVYDITLIDAVERYLYDMDRMIQRDNMISRYTTINQYFNSTHYNKHCIQSTKLHIPHINQYCIQRICKHIQQCNHAFIGDIQLLLQRDTDLADDMIDCIIQYTKLHPIMYTAADT